MLEAIIIDDEKRAREVLTYTLKRHCGDKINLVGEASNVKDGVDLIENTKPQIVFLDIEMPDYLGTELSSFFTLIDFEIIFVTAYSIYALKAFELSAVDYLLKPIEPQKLIKAVNKVILNQENRRKSERLKILEETLKTGNTEKISIPYVGGYHIITLSDIILIKADGAYSEFILKKDEILVSKNLSQTEKLLHNFNQFFRVHRSYIINLNYLKNYSSANKQITLTNNIKLFLSQEKAKILADKLNKKAS